MKKMNNVTIKSALAALLVSAPLAGAFAEPLTRPAPEDLAYTNSLTTSVDTISTGSIRPAASDTIRRSPADAAYNASIETLQRHAANVSLDQLLASQIKAAEANISAARQNGYVNEGHLAQIRSELASIRQQAANGGTLSEASYRTLSGQLQSVNTSIHALTNG